MGRASQVFGYIFGLIILLVGLILSIAGLNQPSPFFGGFVIIGLLVTIFGFVIMYLAHRSRPTKEKRMLKMQAEEYFREQKLKKEREEREKKDMEREKKDMEREKKDMEREKKDMEREKMDKMDKMEKDMDKMEKDMDKMEKEKNDMEGREKEKR